MARDLQDAVFELCEAFPGAERFTSHGSPNFRIQGGKVFAIAGWSEGEAPFVTFKCSPSSFDILKEQPGLRPAPYLASRGMSWIQRTGDEAMSDADLRRYIAESHRLVAAGLTKKKQKELGLLK